MITPLFKVDQDSQFLHMTIKVKYVKFSEVEFFIEGNNFRLYLKPYHLNLHFSDNLKGDSENNNSKYDVDKGVLQCKIEKETEGVIFSNLDMISTLLHENSNNMNHTGTNLSKKVEEISLDSNLNVYDNSIKASEPTTYSIHDKLNQEIFKMDDSDAFNEYLLDSLFNNVTKTFEDISLSTNINDNYKLRYGFNNEFSDVFKNREEDRIELLDIDPGTVELKHRYFAKMEKENEDFIPERYVYDELMLEKEDEGFVKLLNKKLPNKDTVNTAGDSEGKISYNFSEKEMSMLQSINKTKLSLLDVDKDIYFHFYLQAIDVLFAVLYDYRSTELEHNSESGWTISKLSALFSCCVDYNKLFFSFSSEPPMNYLEESVRHVLISSFRRVLCYPLYRNYKMCRKIKDDLCEILSKGVFGILKFFLRVKNIFERSEPRHLLNKIYVDMLFKWLQFHSNENIWRLLSKIVSQIDIEKEELKLDLEEYEKEFELDIKSEENFEKENEINKIHM